MKASTQLNILSICFFGLAAISYFCDTEKAYQWLAIVNVSSLNLSLILGSFVSNFEKD